MAMAIGFSPRVSRRRAPLPPRRTKNPRIFRETGQKRRPFNVSTCLSRSFASVSRSFAKAPGLPCAGRRGWRGTPDGIVDMRHHRRGRPGPTIPVANAWALLPDAEAPHPEERPAGPCLDPRRVIPALWWDQSWCCPPFETRPSAAPQGEVVCSRAKPRRCRSGGFGRGRRRRQRARGRRRARAAPGSRHRPR